MQRIEERMDEIADRAVANAADQRSDRSRRGAAMREPPKYAKLAKRVEEIEALVCPPKQRKCLMIVVAGGGEENPAKARALEEHLRACPQDPKDVEDYDWIGIITGVPRSAGFGQWSAAQDVAASQDAEQESMPARRAGDSSAS
jgi:hypothetical protein